LQLKYLLIPVVFGLGSDFISGVLRARIAGDNGLKFLPDLLGEFAAVFVDFTADFFEKHRHKRHENLDQCWG
jgi:hypothetical protein